MLNSIAMKFSLPVNILGLDSQRSCRALNDLTQQWGVGLIVVAFLHPNQLNEYIYWRYNLSEGSAVLKDHIAELLKRFKALASKLQDHSLHLCNVFLGVLHSQMDIEEEASYWLCDVGENRDKQSVCEIALEFITGKDA